MLSQRPHNVQPVDFSNERRIDCEYKAAEVQLTLEKLELEFNAVREAHQQSQQELLQLRANQENMMEEGLQEMQAQLDELHAHVHATKVELASSGAVQLQCEPCCAVCS